jgi:ribosomal protein S18 acetylase RimI-like enzyme
MRFRYMQLSDIPEAGKLYTQLQEDHRPEELNYPNIGPQDPNEFMLSLARQLIGNPAWFSIVGVVGSKIMEDAQGVKHVIGGKAKAIIAVSLTQRTVGNPKDIAFFELMIVDREFRKHDIGRKLTHAAVVESSHRGAQALECAWNPGSLGEQLWTAAGIRPYRVLGAWVDEDGNPRTDIPLARKPDAPAPKPKKSKKPKAKPAPIEGDEADEGT